MKTQKQIVSGKYNEMTRKIEEQISELQHRLIKHHDKQRKRSDNYGFLGDLGHIRKSLQTIIDFLPG